MYYLDLPPPSRSAKWRFRFPTKTVTVLVGAGYLIQCIACEWTVTNWSKALKIESVGNSARLLAAVSDAASEPAEKGGFGSFERLAFLYAFPCDFPSFLYVLWIFTDLCMTAWPQNTVCVSLQVLKDLTWPIDAYSCCRCPAGVEWLRKCRDSFHTVCIWIHSDSTYPPTWYEYTMIVYDINVWYCYLFEEIWSDMTA